MLSNSEQTPHNQNTSKYLGSFSPGGSEPHEDADKEDEEDNFERSGFTVVSPSPKKGKDGDTQGATQDEEEDKEVYAQREFCKEVLSHNLSKMPTKSKISYGGKFLSRQQLAKAICRKYKIDTNPDSSFNFWARVPPSWPEHEVRQEADSKTRITSAISLEVYAKRLARTLGVTVEGVNLDSDSDSDSDSDTDADLDTDASSSVSKFLGLFKQFNDSAKHDYNHCTINRKRMMQREGAVMIARKCHYIVESFPHSSPKLKITPSSYWPDPKHTPITSVTSFNAYAALLGHVDEDSSTSDFSDDDGSDEYENMDAFSTKENESNGKKFVRAYQKLDSKRTHTTIVFEGESMGFKTCLRKFLPRYGFEVTLEDGQLQPAPPAGWPTP